MAPALLALLLAGPLETWRLEIEKTGPQSVYLLRMEPGAAVPADTPHRAVLEPFTQNANFQEQFARAQALSITYSGNEGRLSFVLLNQRHTPPEDEPYVIAHEYGHLWLKAQRYPAPTYTGGPTGCLAVLTGDAVQHVLIREEMDRRQIDWRPSWIRTLESALAAMESQKDPPAPNRCLAMTQVILWIDVELGLTDAQWPKRKRFLELLAKQFPATQPAAPELAAYLRSQNLVPKDEHEQALRVVFKRLKELALGLPNR